MTELRNVLAQFGPYRGRIISLESGEFDQALADRWAIDPYAEAPAEPPALITPEEALEIEGKAREAAARLTGVVIEAEGEAKRKTAPREPEPPPQPASRAIRR
jgi:hypothetical protein